MFHPTLKRDGSRSSQRLLRTIAGAHSSASEFSSLVASLERHPSTGECSRHPQPESYRPFLFSPFPPLFPLDFPPIRFPSVCRDWAARRRSLGGSQIKNGFHLRTGIGQRGARAQLEAGFPGYPATFSLDYCADICKFTAIRHQRFVLERGGCGECSDFAPGPDQEPFVCEVVYGEDLDS